MSELEPLTLAHVERPMPPWRDPGLKMTECGLPAAGHPVITREAFAAKVEHLGQQRSMMTTCVTCWNTARRWPDWAASPVACIQRETHHASRYNFNAGDPDFRRELLAIAELIARHPDEFAAIMEGLADASDLAARRAQRRYRRGAR